MKTPSKEEIAEAANKFSRNSDMMDGKRINVWEINAFKAGYELAIQELQQTPQSNDCPLNEPKCWAIDCNCKPAPQSVELMTLEELMDEHRLYMCGIKDMPTQKVTYSGAIKVAEIYASQFKAKSESLQLELEQVKAERDALFSLLKRVDRVFIRKDLSNVGAYYEFTDTREAVNKALQSTKQ